VWGKRRRGEGGGRMGGPCATNNNERGFQVAQEQVQRERGGPEPKREEALSKRE